MTDAQPLAPRPDTPTPAWPARGPRMQGVHAAGPDLTRRAAMEKTRGRLVIASMGFSPAVRRGRPQARGRHRHVPDAVEAPGSPGTASGPHRRRPVPADQQPTRHAAAGSWAAHARHGRGPQRRDPGDLAAHRWAVCQPARDDGHRRRRAEAEIRAAQPRPGGGAGAPGEREAVCLSRPQHHAETSTSRSTTSASPASISRRPSAAVIRRAGWRRT